MTKVRVTNESEITVTPRVLQMSGMFDLPPTEKSRVEFTIDMPLEEREWQIGLVVGPSGSGKSSLARQMWPGQVLQGSGFDWPSDRCVLDGFPTAMSIKDVVGLLGSVGFNSPPAWMRPFHVLSTGEQFRATIARAMAETEGLVVIDEFTSVVDRQVAKVASHSVQKAIRRADRQFVAVTCHYDVVDWLQPDWIATPASESFQWRSLQRRPTLELRICEVPRKAWEVFRHHHYLSGELSPAAQCFGGWIGDELVAFTSYIHFPHPRTRNIKMGHRLVVLPDYQGLGIGGRMDDWLGQHLYEQGYRYHNAVAHPAMIRTYLGSPRWKLVGKPGRENRVGTTTKNAALRKRNIDPRRLNVWSFEYVPARRSA